MRGMMMKNIKTSNTLKAIGFNVLMAASSGAFSQMYVGASLGQGEDFIGEDEDVTFELLGGYRFSENFSAEISYLDLGEAKNAFSTVSAYTWTASAIAYLPINEKTEFFAKIGMFDISGEVRSVSDGKSRTNDTDLMYGVGVNFSLTENLKTNLQYRVFSIDVEEERGDVSDPTNISAGLTFSF